MSLGSTPGIRAIGCFWSSKISGMLGVLPSGPRRPSSSAYSVAASEKTSPDSVGGLAVEDLRRRVRRGDRLHGLAQLHARIGHRGQPEVGQAGIAVRVDQDVGRLDVAVQHAARVGGGQRVGDPDADVADLLLARPLFGFTHLVSEPPGHSSITR